MKIRPKTIAMTHKYIQPNHPYYQNWIVLDLDYDAVLVDLIYSTVGVPLPNILVENKHNGRAHLFYQLQKPVYKTDASRLKPIAYLNAATQRLQALLNADVGYVGLIAKNPLNKQWRAYTLRDKPYSLNELASKLEIDWKQINKPIKQNEAVGLGRNCYLFHTARLWAYVAIRKHRGATYNQWLQSVLDHCLKLNEGITEPLGYNELKGIAKSIARWVWKRDPHCYAMFIERQSIKGRKGGKAKGEAYSFKREQAVKLKEQGMNNTQIAKQLSVTRRTIINWLGV
ncbi:replication initiation protein [Acinetobacter baumannii]|uniref:replication initiation protein n=1 Tax=Acinetobacter baumannii TaxID=470 RepID=UPI00385E9785